VRGHKWELRRRPGRNIEVVFYVPGGGGRPIERSTGTSDEGEAAIRAGEIWVKELRRAGKPVPEEAAAAARVSVEDAAAEFLIHLGRQAAAHREQYVRRYEADLNLYAIPKSDEELRQAAAERRVLWQPSWTYVDEITSARWEDEKLRLHKKNGGPLGWNSIRHLANTLRHLLRFCVERSYIASAPELLSPSRRMTKREARPRRALTEKERERFLRWVYKYTPAIPRKGRQATHPPGTAGRFYEALHYSLLRRGELWAATLRWMDRRAKLLHIPAEHTKSGDPETIPLHERVETALLGQAKAAGVKSKDEPVFGVINVRPAFEWAMKKAKLDRHGITPHHTTRHTGGTLLAGKTKSRDQLKKAGRWRSDQSVDPYLHVDAEDARELMEKL
jgi:hypothetical protein